MAEVRNDTGHGVAVVVGKLQGIRKAGTAGFAHLITMAAPDRYTAPATVEVLAKGRLGETGAEVRVPVRIGGYRRSYKQTDQDTGEIRNVQTADVKLYAVEQ